MIIHVSNVGQPMPIVVNTARKVRIAIGGDEYAYAYGNVYADARCFIVSFPPSVDAGK